MAIKRTEVVGATAFKRLKQSGVFPNLTNFLEKARSSHYTRVAKNPELISGTCITNLWGNAYSRDTHAKAEWGATSSQVFFVNNFSFYNFFAGKLGALPLKSNAGKKAFEEAKTRYFRSLEVSCSGGTQSGRYNSIKEGFEFFFAGLIETGDSYEIF